MLIDVGGVRLALESNMVRSSLCVALTGATGFVGRHVLPRLLLADYRVRALVRDPDALTTADARLHTVKGDLFNDAALTELVKGADAVIHLVGIIQEIPRKGQTFDRVHTLGTQRLLGAAQSAGIKRWVHMSALGSRPEAVSDYHRTKWAAERMVRDSGLDYTIFRPSIIHGPDGEFMQMVKGFCCNLFPPFMPYFGAGLMGGCGAGRLQPVWVEDVARCFTEAVTHPEAVGETYPMGGPDEFTWPQLYLTCHQHLPGARAGRKPLAVPVWYANLIAGKPGVPFNRDQVIMSQEDSVCKITKVPEHFGFECAAFEPTFAGYAGQI